MRSTQLEKNEMALVSDIVAGMHSSNDLEFVSIADITSSTDIGTMVSIQQANIVVNVFHLLQSQKVVGQPIEFLQNGIEVESIGREPEDEVPQAKVIFLPSKELQGVWNSYAITSLPLIMS